MLSTGIRGLDSIIGGGIPERYVITVFGSYGTGKTTFGLHFIYEGLKNGENCIFISLDEDEESIIESAESFGMEFSKYKQNLEILRLDPVVVKESLDKLRGDLMGIIKRANAKRIVVDTISVLESLFDEKERWIAISNFRDIIKNSGLTAIFTSEADKFNPLSTKYGILEYMSDGAIALRYIKKKETDEPVLALEILKIRRVKHPRRLIPYVITERGIEVLESAEIF